jgi:hypothetical protein
LKQLAYDFFWKQQVQLIKTTSSLPPRNCAALNKLADELVSLRTSLKVVFTSCSGCFQSQNADINYQRISTTEFRLNLL